eukprot:Sspe_Gene.109958::Locus_90226_Transcript_1_1_Confidence_1.000_Length_402::g.109958::m.109958
MTAIPVALPMYPPMHGFPVYMPHSICPPVATPSPPTYSSAATVPVASPALPSPLQHHASQAHPQPEVDMLRGCHDSEVEQLLELEIQSLTKMIADQPCMRK